MFKWLKVAFSHIPSPIKVDAHKSNNATARRTYIVTGEPFKGITAQVFFGTIS